MNASGLIGALLVCIVGVPALANGEVGTPLAQPATFALGAEMHRMREEEIRSLELFPLVNHHVPQHAFVLSKTEVDVRVSSAKSLSEVPEELRGSLASLPVVREASPFEIGEWVPMPDGTMTYLLLISLEGAERIRVRFRPRIPLPGAFVIGYVRKGEEAAEVAGPIAMQPVEGHSVFLPSIGASEILVEVRNLPASAAANLMEPPFLIEDVQYFASDLRQLFGFPPLTGEGEFDGSAGGVQPLATAVCPSYQDVNCFSNMSSVKNGVVKLYIAAGSSGGWCTGWLLRDNESTTDIPYVVTSGHCIAGSLSVQEIYFWDESSSCNASGNHSWRQIIAPRIFELGYENTAPPPNCPLFPDWGLVRFNLVGDVGHLPTFLDTKTATQPFGRKIYQVHHPGGDRKKYSQGDLSSNYDQYIQYFDYDNGNWAEGGSSGSPIIDSTDLRVIGIMKCTTGVCSSIGNAALVKFATAQDQIFRFLSPALATPVIINASAPSSSPPSSSFLVTITIRNGGAYTSTDGHIHIALPSYSTASDANLVALESKSADLTYEEYPAGFSGLGRRNGSLDSSAAYLHIESRDTSWTAGEENFITLRVTPKASGSLQILYRSAMRSQNEYYYNAPSDASYDVLDTDQQWPEKRITVTIATVPTAPDATTGSASALGTATATLNGSVNPNGSSTNAWFEWGTSTSYGNSTSQQSVGAGSSTLSYNASISGLTCNTAYHFRARASNGSGGDSGSDATFSTQQCPSNPPSIFTDPATSVGTTSATLRGQVNPNASSTSAWFEYGTTLSYGSTTSPQSMGSGTSLSSYSRGVSLTCGTTVHFRAVASNAAGAVTGSDRSFTTSPCTVTPPEVMTNAASAVGSSSATLNGQADPNGSTTTAWFEWGMTTSYGTSTSPQGMGAGTSFASYSQDLSGLDCNTTYHYRAIADNAGGTVPGLDTSFTTAACPVGSGLALHLVPPCRVVDTRESAVLQSGVPYGLQIAGHCGIPMDALAVVANITVVSPSDAGWMTIWPWNLTKPNTSNISHAQRTRANNAILMLATDGYGDVRLESSIANGGTTHLIVDVSGYFQ